MATADEFRDDLYEILGLEPGADEKEVARAYKKKSIVHHPDRGGDVKKFLELTHARDVLLDPKQKEAYDKKLSRELMAKRQQREREAELDAKRRQMRDELLRKEQASALPRKNASSRQDRGDLSKFREKGLARQKELQEKLARDARRQRDLEKAKQAVESKSAGKAQRTVKFKWDRRQFSHSDDTLSAALRDYGAIKSIKIKASSAKVEFADTSAAARVVRIEGHKDIWKEVSLQGHLVETGEAFADAPTAASSNASTVPSGPIALEELSAFEQRVLEKLRARVKHQEAQPVSVS